MARHIVSDTALHEIGLIRMPKQNEGRAIVECLAVPGDLPPGFQKIGDRGTFAGGCRGRRRRKGDRDSGKDYSPGRKRRERPSKLCTHGAGHFQENTGGNARPLEVTPVGTAFD
jgi:hypothetical protein